MVRKWIVLFGIALFLLVICIIVGIWYLRGNPASMSKAIVTIASNVQKGNVAPDELTSGFDTTVNAPVFAVESANRKNNTLNLKIMWPKELSGQEIVSKLGCDGGGIKIVKSGENQGVIVTRDDFFDKVEMGALFSGLCSSQRCEDMVKDCVLTLGVGMKI